MTAQERKDPLTVALLITALAVIVLRNAWVTEDAYITFRTVDNFIHGYGLQWNTAERVQVFTHPLWLFLVSLVYYGSLFPNTTYANLNTGRYRHLTGGR